MRSLLRLIVVLGVLGIGAMFVAQGSGTRNGLVPMVRSLTAAANTSKDVVLADDSLSEVSGCAVSEKTAGVLWVHNDSGDKAVLYAVRLSDGVTLGKVTLKGVNATDFEDMSLAAGRLFVGDIGDNSESRKSISVHSVVEPSVSLTEVGQKWKLKPKSVHLSYPDGARNAEAMLIDPNGSIVLVDKVDGTVWRESKKGKLQSVATLKLPLVTGAALVPGSHDVLIRTYPFIYRYALAKGAAFDSVWSAKPQLVTAPLLPQAEAVCASPDGTHGYTLSESRGQPVRIVPITWK